jgi:hypothetical protein
MEKINKARNSLSFRLSYTPSTVSPAPFNWPFLLIALLTAALLFFFLRRVYYYNPEPLSDPYYNQIGGWLILAGIGLAIAPLAKAIQIATAGFFNIVQWRILTDPGYAAYNPSLGTFVVVEFLCNLALLGYAVLMNVLFWTKRTSLPKLILLLYACNVGVLIADTWVSHWMGFEKNSADSMKDVIRAAIGAAIWIPYFLVSDRVKATFTRRL